MDQKIYNKIREIVYRKSGITLSEGKVALVRARLSKRMRVLNLASHKDYLDFVLNDSSGKEIISMIDAVSTNVTSFFREYNHFELLTDFLQHSLSKGQKRFRFWSAACSSGEEPYSMAMTIKNVAEKMALDIKILATDISTDILQHAVKGEYLEERLKGVSDSYRKTFFDKVIIENDTCFKVAPFLRNMVVFKHFNLSKVPFPMNGPMDIIFCRNVMIYFDNIVRQKLIDEFYRLLKPGGYLFIGHAESLSSIKTDLKSVKPTVYKKE